MDNKEKVYPINFIEFPIKTKEILAVTKNFYNSVFKWNFQDWGEDYSDTPDSGIPSGFNSDPEHKPAFPLAVIYSANLEESKSAVEKSGGKITKDVFSFPGGRRFHFKDPAGNELAVWSDK